jgi:hypothetical protein
MKTEREILIEIQKIIDSSLIQKEKYLCIKKLVEEYNMGFKNKKKKPDVPEPVGLIIHKSEEGKTKSFFKRIFRIRE